MAHEEVALDSARFGIGGETHEARVETVCDSLLYAFESTSTYKQYVFCVYSNHWLLGMLASALWRHVDH